MAECQCSFFWFSSQLTFIFFSALKFMLIHDKDTRTMLADTEFLLSVITTRNGKKKTNNENETQGNGATNMV